MARNHFHKDSFLTIKFVSRNIVNDNIEDAFSVIQNILFLAIGIEKILKAILFEINPLYILESPDFKNSVPIIYNDLINDKSELSKTPNMDVIAYQASVMRAIVFSKTALENKNTLMKIKNARDIIVHNKFSELDINDLKMLLKRDFYPLLSSFSKEHSLGGQTNFFNNLHSKLAAISSALQDDIENQINLKIESSQSHWSGIKGVHTYDKKACKHKTAITLQKDFAYPAVCPSCKNYGIVYTTPLTNFDSYKSELIQIGLETKAFKCNFCNLEVTDYKELDYLKIIPDVKNKGKVISDYLDNIEEKVVD